MFKKFRYFTKLFCKSLCIYANFYLHKTLKLCKSFVKYKNQYVFCYCNSAFFM